MGKKIQELVKREFHIKPANEEDYVSFLFWLISKRLLKLAVLLSGFLSVCYLLWLCPSFAYGGIRSYSFDSIGLKFARGRVQIRGSSGYLAYDGQVKRGAASGTGTLYRKSGGIVYTGAFQNNQYEGEGRLYALGGTLRYEGNFKNNLYSGQGILYRENGSKEYEGEFSQGMKQGEGTLFDGGNNEVYSGTFQKDELLYSSLLGKRTEELNSIYHGGRKIYTDGAEEFSVALLDIDAVYRGSQDSSALNDSMKVTGIYVLKNEIVLGENSCKSIPELRKLLGEPEYEGNSAVTFAEAVAVFYLNQNRDCLFGPVNMEFQEEFSDVVTVKNYQADYLIYLYTYTLDEMRYTFYCDKKNGDISMYLIEKEP